MSFPQNEKTKFNEDILYQSHIAHIPSKTVDFLVYYAEIMNSTTFEFLHSHHCYEIYYILQGEIKMNICGNSYLLEEGHLMLIMPEIEHEVMYEPSRNCKFFVITFEFCPRTGKVTKAYNLSRERFETDTILNALKIKTYYTCIDKFTCGEIVKEIETELTNKDIGWNIKVINLYFHFVISALRNISFSTPYPPYSRENVNSAVEISKYMHKHLNEDITLKSVADSLNMTTRNVSRLFKEYFGTTFGKALSRFRFNCAKYYVSSTDYSLHEISKLVGFESSRPLMKMFGKNEDLTITKYKSKKSQTDE